jgi:ribosomal protein L24
MRIGDRVIVTRGNHEGVRGIITAFHGIGSGQQAEIQLGFEKTNCTFGVFIKDIQVLTKAV